MKKLLMAAVMTGMTCSAYAAGQFGDLAMNAEALKASVAINEVKGNSPVPKPVAIDDEFLLNLGVGAKLILKKDIIFPAFKDGVTFYNEKFSTADGIYEGSSCRIQLSKIANEPRVLSDDLIITKFMNSEGEGSQLLNISPLGNMTIATVFEVNNKNIKSIQCSSVVGKKNSHTLLGLTPRVIDLKTAFKDVFKVVAGTPSQL
jgi:hypothetical protein